jgi:hypothetical protein
MLESLLRVAKGYEESEGCHLFFYSSPQLEKTSPTLIPNFPFGIRGIPIA